MLSVCFKSYLRRVMGTVVLLKVVSSKHITAGFDSAQQKVALSEVVGIAAPKGLGQC